MEKREPDKIPNGQEDKKKADRRKKKKIKLTIWRILQDGAASDRVFAPTVQDKNGLAAVAISVSGRAAAGAVFFAIAKT